MNLHICGPFSSGLVVACLLGAGCGKSSDETAAVISPVEAAAQLDQAFEQSTTDEIHQNIQTASEALREGNYEKAVVALQVTRSATALTLDQGLAVHNSLVSLEQNLINAAAAGDANAQRSYDLLKKSKRN